MLTLQHGACRQEMGTPVYYKKIMIKIIGSEQYQLYDLLLQKDYDKDYRIGTVPAI